MAGDPDGGGQTATAGQKPAGQAAAATFAFLDPGVLADGELALVLVERVAAWRVFGGEVPCYRFEMRVGDKRAGHLNLRVTDAAELVRYAGHIGYGVDERFRGRRFAERACRLVLPLARRHGLAALWITCDPDNAPSRRTCERLGAEFVETAPIPAGSEMHARGERLKRRYRLDLHDSKH